jgi:hypothetical protein
LLVNRYFVLTSDDLEEWAQEPEAFHHEQEMVQFREKLRPCAESLYLALFERHREVTVPAFERYISSALLDIVAAHSFEQKTIEACQSAFAVMLDVTPAANYQLSMSDCQIRAAL